MEELLNKLIEKGWKPFGDNAIKIDYDGMETRYGYGAITYKYRDSYIDDDGDEVEYEEWRRQFNLRELVSKESGLWQFCVKNKLVKEDDGHITRIISEYKDNKGIIDGGSDYHYWLMICSILDDSELEDFLIENIKVGNED